MLRLLRLDPDADQDLPLPRYQTPGSAGCDLLAAIIDPITIAPMQRVAVPTGLAMAVPFGYEAQVRPRSGNAIRHGLTMINSPGTIDSDYRGEVKVLLVNFGSRPYTIHRGDRIAQLVITPIVQVHIVSVDDLDATERGSGGFGSTGR